MKQFEIWFVYYDALFLNQTPKLSFSFYQKYIHSQNSHWIAEATWNNNCCQPLALAFEYLEEFIKDQANWISSQCSKQEFESTETAINDLLYFLWMEKSYSYLFWGTDSRRVEASLAHLYTFLQMFVKALIPQQKMTIFLCKAANKLSVQISKLQKLINQILKCVNPIASFLSLPKFDEEQPIIKNFFENLIVFMKKLPHIRRNKLNHVHNLTKFISLLNPIQICSDKRKLDFFGGKRKKSNSQEIKLKSRPKTDPMVQGHRSFLFNEVKKSCQKRSLTYQQSSKHKNYQNLCIKNNKRLFQFPEKMKKNYKINSFNETTEVLSSKASIEFMNKNFSSNNLKTMTDATTTILTQSNLDKLAEQIASKKSKSFGQPQSLQKIQSKTQSIRQTNSSISKVKSSKLHEAQYEKQVEKRSNLSVRQCSIRKRQLSEATIETSEAQQNHGYKIFYQQPKKFIHVKTGIICKSKWEFVRSYVHQRIKLRKIDRILSE